MDTEVDLTTADRDVLIALIVRQQAIIARLEKRIAELEGQAKPANSRRMPGLKPNAKADRKPAPPKGPRKPRPHGFARARMTPTRRVEHAMDNCPDCGTQLSGGWTHRTREVIELPVVPVQVTEHVYLARTCPACRRRCTPPAELDSVVLGQQRLGVNVLSLIATLREEGRLPIRSVQWYLDTVHQLRLSVGAIVSAIHRTAQRAQPAVAAILDRIRASPVVHADETGWREDGAFWLAFLRSLTARGLSGVELVTSDAHQGLKNAIAAVFAGASWQRCRTHFMANLLTRVPKRAQPGVATMVRTIYQLLSPAEVHGQLDRVV